MWLLLTGLILISHAQDLPVVRLPPGIAEEHRRAIEERFMLETNSTMELRAVGQVGGEPVAMIDVNGHPVMVKVGIVLAGWDVRAITVAAQEVALLHVREKAARILKITNFRSIEFPHVSEVQVDWLLSQQDQRSLVGRQEYMPPEVLRVWSKINREAQEAILLNYLRMGRVFGCIVLDGEHIGDVFYGRLWESQRRKLTTEKRHAFLASLDETQRAVFTAVAAVPAVDLRNPPPPEERERMMAWIRSKEMGKQKVVEALNPEQRTLYEAYMAVMGQPPNR